VIDGSTNNTTTVAVGTSRIGIHSGRHLVCRSGDRPLLEAKANLLRLREDIPLADAELAAVEDGLAAYEELLSKLADIPTPAGPTPRQLSREHLVRLRGGEQPTRPDHW
jgi:hypothetical protein